MATVAVTYGFDSKNVLEKSKPDAVLDSLLKIVDNK
jgi:phosphoglycolate phosphatase-like HAD superfamily hydrolase